MSGPPRPLLFALALAALLASAALLALGPGPRETPPSAPGGAAPAPHPGAPREAEADDHAAHPPGGEDLPAARPQPPALAAARRAVERAARRFLAAFGRYEVGDLAPSVQAALRGACTEEFATALLAAPPRPLAGAMPARAKLVGIEVALGAGAAPRAVVSGALRRARSLEGFAFAFERRGERWLAAGVAE